VEEEEEEGIPNLGSRIPIERAYKNCRQNHSEQANSLVQVGTSEMQTS
jgi:hypothetical protein